MVGIISSIFCLLTGASAASGKVFEDIPNKSCFDVSIPVNVTSTNYVWGIDMFKDNLDVTAFNTAFNRRNHATPFDPITGTKNKSATYTISGTVCHPSNMTASTLLVATHGGSFDRGYWDSPFQPANYSFVNFAIARGYSVFFYDRLGTGKSSIESGYVNQMSIQIAVLEQLLTQARAGFPLTSASPSAGGKRQTRISPPEKIVLIGHAAGSIISAGLIASNSSTADGAILTGLGLNSGLDNAFGLTVATWQPKIASGLKRRWRATGYDSGSIAWIDLYAHIQTLFRIPYFDFSIAQEIEDISWPVSVMEALTLGKVNVVSPTYTAPVLFMVGDNDYIMCGGDCTEIFAPAVSKVFPASLGFEAYAHPNCGHAINFHYNATGAFKVMTDFLAKNRL